LALNSEEVNHRNSDDMSLMGLWIR